MIRVGVEPFEIVLTQPIHTARGIVKNRGGAILVVRDGDGHEGRGELAPLPGWSTVTLDEARQQLEQCAAALADDGINATCAAMAPEVEAAVDAARVTLAAARDGRVVWDVLGGVSGVITVNGLAGGPSPEDVARAVGAVVEAGYRTVKVKLGFEDDVERIQSVSTAAPDGVRIRLDANAMWTISQASELCACAHDLLGHRLEYVEDPVSSASELEELRAVTSVPIAADELIRSRADLDTLLAKRLVDVVVAKPPLLGGISKVRLMADAASSADVDVVISSMFDGPVGLEAWCHLAAGINGDRAHGLGTAQFLAADAARVLVPREGMIHLS